MAEEIKKPRFGAPVKRGLTRIAAFTKKMRDAALMDGEMLGEVNAFNHETAKEKRELEAALVWIETKCLVLK